MKKTDAQLTEICNSYLDNFKYENRLATMYIDKFETKFKYF